jgi:hypothetical protein
VKIDILKTPEWIAARTAIVEFVEAVKDHPDAQALLRDISEHLPIHTGVIGTLATGEKAELVLIPSEPDKDADA